CGILERFAQDGFPTTATKEEIVQRLMRSDLLDQMLSWHEFSTRLDSQDTRKRKAACVLLEYVYDRKFRIYDAEPILKVHWRVLRMRTADELLEQISDVEAREALLTLCYKFAPRGVRSIDQEEVRSQKAAEQMHPQCQVAPVGYSLAASVLAHVALAEGRR